MILRFLNINYLKWNNDRHNYNFVPIFCLCDYSIGIRSISSRKMKKSCKWRTVTTYHPVSNKLHLVSSWIFSNIKTEQSLFFNSVSGIIILNLFLLTITEWNHFPFWYRQTNRLVHLVDAQCNRRQRFIGKRIKDRWEERIRTLLVLDAGITVSVWVWCPIISRSSHISIIMLVLYSF